MKVIYLIRHAKSSWDNPSLKDRDRPLNKRGLRDAPFMAKLLKGKDVQADLIVSSPANRAYTTATYFAAEMSIPEKNILVQNQIYEAFPNDILQIVTGLDDQHSTVFIFGHNPTMTSLVNRFTDTYLPNVPTCGVAQIEANTQTWNSFLEAEAKLTAFYYPKQYF